MPQINFSEELQKLIELQKTDARVFDIKKEVDAFPDKIAAMKGLIKEKESIFKASDDKLKQFQLKRKDKEIELTTKEEGVKKYQSQQFQVKTNQEYNALQKEIESLRADKSVLEEDLINIFDDIEKTEAELKSNKQLYEQEKAKIEAEIKEVEKHKNDIEGQLKSLEDERKAKAQAINPDVLAKYDRILNGRDGLALVPIMGEACGGCNMSLPPQVINEIRLRNDIIMCGNCARILYSVD